MFCSIYKWLISQAGDSEKPISGFVKNHTHKCDSCREFAQLCESLKPKLAQDKHVLLEKIDGELNKRILSAISREKASQSSRQRTPGRFSLRNPSFAASVAAASLVLVISFSIIFIVIPQSKKELSFVRPSELVNAASPELLLVKAESPLAKEYQELKKTFNSTKEYLRAALDFRIGE